jgi:glycine/D-amino acid oxidase-like deaminating enzyme
MPAEMQRITGSEYYLSGLLTPKTVTIQAAAYTRGFARGMSEKVDIYEKTPCNRSETHKWNLAGKNPQRLC